MKKGARYRKKQIWLVLKGQDFEEKKTSLAEKVPQTLHSHEFIDLFSYLEN